MKSMLFIAPVYNDKIADGLNIRIVNFAKILSKKYKLSLLCFNDPEIKDEIFEEVIILKLKNIFFTKLLKVLIFKSPFEVYNTIKIKKTIKKISGNYDSFFCTFISTALPVVKSNITKPIFVDFVDAISLHYKEAKNINIFRKVYYIFCAKRTFELEKFVIKKSTIGLITSDIEKNVFKYQCSDEILKKIKVVSNGTTLPKYTKKKEVSKSIAFLGSMDYYPNISAAKSLIEIIFPRLIEVYDDLNCYIIGGNPTEEIKNFANERINITGYIENLDDIMNKIDIVILPMDIASGIQNKLLTSLSYAKPVIITNRVDTGYLPFVNWKNIIFANSNNEYIDSVIKLYDNPGLISEIGDNAYDTIKDNISWDNIEIKLLSLIESLLKE